MAYYKRDMLSIRSRNLLADYLADLTLLVDSVEEYRTALAELEGFDGVGLFRFLDRDQAGYLSVSDFQWLIGSENKKLLHYGFSWFDTSKIGEISRLQFLDYILPRENAELRDIVSVRIQTAPVDNYQDFPPTLQTQVEIFKTLFLEIMKKQTRLIPLRRELMAEDDYSIKAVMNSLDCTSKGWVNVQDLFKFLKNYDIDVTTYHMKELLGNYDSDTNGKITFKELQWIIEGLENKKSPYRKILKHPTTAVKQPLSVSKSNNANRLTHSTAQKSKERSKSKINPASSSKNASKAKLIIDSTKNKEKSQKKEKMKVRIFEPEEENSKNITLQNLKCNSENERALGFCADIVALKKSFQILEKQANQIDEELIKYDLQLEQSNRIELLRELEKVKLGKKLRQEELLKQEELDLLRREKQRQAEIERIHEEQRLIRLKKEEEHRYYRSFLIQESNRRLAAQIEEEKLRMAEIESSARQQVVQARLRASMIAKEERLRAISRQKEKLLAEDLLRQKDRHLRQNQYFWKFNNHIRSDPLGIQAQIMQTDIYLERSKQLIRDIQMQKFSSDYSPLKISPSRVRNNGLSSKKDATNGDSATQSRFQSPNKLTAKQSENNPFKQETKFKTNETRLDYH